LLYAYRDNHTFASSGWATYLFLGKPMKTPLLVTFVAIIVPTMFLSSGCQKKTAAASPNSQSKSESHESTKPLQGADLVGYDGTKLRKSVDHIREANDKA